MAGQGTTTRPNTMSTICSMIWNCHCICLASAHSINNSSSSSSQRLVQQLANSEDSRTFGHHCGLFWVASDMGVSEARDLQQLQPARARRNQLGRITIVVSQNALLWAALYVVASTIFLLVIGAIDTQAIPSAVMYLVAVRDTSPGLLNNKSDTSCRASYHYSTFFCKTSQLTYVREPGT